MAQRFGVSFGGWAHAAVDGVYGPAGSSGGGLSLRPGVHVGCMIYCWRREREREREIWVFDLFQGEREIWVFDLFQGRETETEREAEREMNNVDDKRGDWTHCVHVFIVFFGQSSWPVISLFSTEGLPANPWTASIPPAP